MPHIKQQACVPHDCACMYQLVNRLEDYPSFVPHCSDAKVLYHETPHDLHAYMAFQGYGISTHLITHNHLTNNQSIHMHLLEGPLRALHGVWLFEERPHNHCLISLSLQFEFKKRTFDWLFQKLITHLMHEQLQAFCQRAKQLYPLPQKPRLSHGH